MPFPRPRLFGSAESGRGARRRSRRTQRRGHEEDTSLQVDPTVVTERRQRKIGIGIGTAFLFIIVGVVAFGYYQEFYKPPRVWAGSVSNVEFNMGDLVARIRVLQGVNRYQGGQVNLSTVPFEYLQDLINAEVLRQRSHSLGIIITEEDIYQELRRQFLPTPDPGQETDPGQLDREFNDNYLRFLTATGLSDSDFRVIIEEQIAVGTLAGLLSLEIDDPQPQVEIQWIEIPLDSEIFPNDVMRRLENEEFIRVAQELNVPSQYSVSSGYVGWVPRGAFPDLDDVIFGGGKDELEPLAAETISEPIFSDNSFFIVKALAVAEERELTNVMALKLTVEAVDAWQENALTSGTEDRTVRLNFNSRLYEWVTNQVFITAPRIDRPTTNTDPAFPQLGQ